MPLEWDCAGEPLAWMALFLGVSFLIVLFAEIGYFDFCSRPVLTPLKKFLEWGIKKLQRKRKHQGYSIKKDFNQDSGVEEHVDKELISFVDIDDSDPRQEEKRVAKLEPTNCSIKVS
jgi:hypothetical protein